MHRPKGDKRAEADAKKRKIDKLSTTYASGCWDYGAFTFKRTNKDAKRCIIYLLLPPAMPQADSTPQ